MLLEGNMKAILPVKSLVPTTAKTHYVDVD